VSLVSYYKHIGYLTQDPSIFDGTVRENIMYGMLKNDAEKKSEYLTPTPLLHAHSAPLHSLGEGDFVEN
jgi:ABC-type transport system involved in cytochrome bd biosynthesis fused ATPase/permease subunit